MVVLKSLPSRQCQDNECKSKSESGNQSSEVSTTGSELFGCCNVFLSSVIGKATFYHVKFVFTTDE